MLLREKFVYDYSLSISLGHCILDLSVVFGFLSNLYGWISIVEYSILDPSLGIWMVLLIHIGGKWSLSVAITDVLTVVVVVVEAIIVICKAWIRKGFKAYIRIFAVLLCDRSCNSEIPKRTFLQVSTLALSGPYSTLLIQNLFLIQWHNPSQICMQVYLYIEASLFIRLWVCLTCVVCTITATCIWYK